MAEKKGKAKPRSRPKKEGTRADVSQTTAPVIDAMTEALRLVAKEGGNPRWFPHGITKIDLEVKVANVEVHVVVSGPDTGALATISSVARDVSPDLIFSIDQRIGSKARGTLAWPAMNLSSRAVSGDSNHPAINVGTWTGNAFQERPGDDPYCDTNGNCWFSVFADNYGRTGMGIHPDGGVPDATLGCIGISDPDTLPWHDALKGKSGKISCLVTEAKPLVTEPEDDGIVEAASNK